MKTPSPEAVQVLETLQRAVNKALDRKKRMGQYAVIWKNGKPVILKKDGGTPGPVQQQDN